VITVWLTGGDDCGGDHPCPEAVVSTDAQPGRRRFAWPGDPDLDVDLDSLTIAGVVHRGGEVTVTLGDGCGWFDVGEFVRVEIPPGSTSRVGGVAVRFDPVGLPTTAEDDLALRLTRIDRWMTTRLPLRLVAAPDRAVVLMESATSWLAGTRAPVSIRVTAPWPGPDDLQDAYRIMAGAQR
jgi:hypothetical protein